MAWSSIEPSVAIISACLPTFAPLFRVNRSRPESNPYYISDRTEASRLNLQFGKSAKHSARMGIKTTVRTSAPNFAMDDDEVELTDKMGCGGGGSMSSRDLESQLSKRDSGDNRIIVSTQVIVSSTRRKDYYLEKCLPDLPKN